MDSLIFVLGQWWLCLWLIMESLPYFIVMSKVKTRKRFSSRSLLLFAVLAASVVIVTDELGGGSGRGAAVLAAPLREDPLLGGVSSAPHCVDDILESPKGQTSQGQACVCLRTEPECLSPILSCFVFCLLWDKILLRRPGGPWVLGPLASALECWDYTSSLSTLEPGSLLVLTICQLNFLKTTLGRNKAMS